MGALPFHISEELNLTKYWGSRFVYNDNITMQRREKGVYFLDFIDSKPTNFVETVIKKKEK